MKKEGNIAVDVGNTFVKVGKFQNDRLVLKQVYSNLESVLKNFSNPECFSWIFSAVGERGEEIPSLFGPYDPLILSRTTRIPMGLDYETPETLGVDRLAAAVGAHTLFEGKNMLVIDAGSCITYDVVSSDGVFRGGVISPGLKMRMKSMHQFTHKLPDISEIWQSITETDIGKSTEQCLLLGTFTSIIHEMDGFIQYFLKEYEDLIVVMTGGDLVHFESKLKRPIFADSNLVLTGLNRILNYNR